MRFVQKKLLENVKNLFTERKICAIMEKEVMNMKKLFAIALAAFLLAGCSNNTTNESTNSAASAEISSETTSSVTESSSESVSTSVEESSSSTESSSVTVESSSSVSSSSTTEKPAESSSSSIGSASVSESGDIFCSEFSIDGETYKFPLKYSDMEKKGWSYKNGGSEKTIKPKQS